MIFERRLLCYLVGHSRPIYELLTPNLNDISAVYEKEFDGMTNIHVSLDQLKEVQHRLPTLLLEQLTDKEKDFLRSFQQADPQWDLMPIAHLKDLPAVRWKLLNIEKMDDHKHQEYGQILKEVLNV